MDRRVDAPAGEGPTEAEDGVTRAAAGHQRPERASFGPVAAPHMVPDRVEAARQDGGRRRVTVAIQRVREPFVELPDGVGGHRAPEVSSCAIVSLPEDRDGGMAVARDRGKLGRRRAGRLRPVPPRPGGELGVAEPGLDRLGQVAEIGAGAGVEAGERRGHPGFDAAI